MNIEYYKTKPDAQHYKGERYFKYNPHKTSVLMIVVNAEEKKTGRPNMKGISLMSTATFMCNYAMRRTPRVDRITQAQFYKQFNKMTKSLNRY